MVAMQIPHTEIQNIKIDDVTGVLLAGGKSIRMGRDKASIILKGVPLYSHSLQLLRDHFQEVMIAGDRIDLTFSGIPALPTSIQEVHLVAYIQGSIQPKLIGYLSHPATCPTLTTDLCSYY